MGGIYLIKQLLTGYCISTKHTHTHLQQYKIYPNMRTYVCYIFYIFTDFFFLSCSIVFTFIVKTFHNGAHTMVPSRFIIKKSKGRAWRGRAAGEINPVARVPAAAIFIIKF